MRHPFTPIVLLAGVQGTAVAPPLTALSNNGAEPGYGHWNVTVTRGNAASGYRWENVLGTYSGTESTITCKQLYDPTVRETTRSCDDPSFRYQVDAMATDGGNTCTSDSPSLIFKLAIRC
jgi:hypothetical protein